MNFKIKLSKLDSIKLITLVLISAALTGCQQPTTLIDKIDPLNPLLTDYTEGRSVQGQPIPCYILGSGDEVIMIMASIHGNEPAGTPLCFELKDYLVNHTEYLDGRTIILMPTANPDGFAARTRHNAQDIDLNRNFLASNRQNNDTFGHFALSEPEAVFIKQVIDEYQPVRIISFHAALACIDYDGPGKDIAEHLANYCDLPVKKLGSRPGSLGSYAGETLGIPIITLEMTDNDYDAKIQTLWQRYGQMTMAFINYPDEPFDD